jgi:hypothetical protein
LSFNGKQFFIFGKPGKISRKSKKIKRFSHGKIIRKKVRIFFLEILRRSIKNKNCVPLKINV